MNRYVLLLAIIWGALVHPLGALVAHLFWGAKASPMDASLFFVPFAGFPYVAFVAAALLLLLARPAFPPLLWSVRAGIGIGAVLALAAQVICWKELPSDAQSALLFLFLPVWAAVASALLLLIVFLVGVAVYLVNRPPTARAT